MLFLLVLFAQAALAHGASCEGASALLPPAQCFAWVALYNATNGASWTKCADKRLDPCSCGRVTCNAAGTAVTNMCVRPRPCPPARRRAPRPPPSLPPLTRAAPLWLASPPRAER